jgi:hypothetical protein
MILNTDKYVEQRPIESRKQAHYHAKPPENSWDNITDYITYTPNWLHADGRIYASAPGEEYRVAEVSPYNPKFETQIEAGVWPIVNALVNKGYLTCASCEGHGRDLDCFVSLVTPTLESAISLANQLSIDPWKITVKTDRSIWDYTSALKTTKNTLSRAELKTKVFPYYNKIFRRNYNEYFFIDMHLAKYCGYGMVWNWLTKTPSKMYKTAMEQMMDHIEKELPNSIY